MQKPCHYSANKSAKVQVNDGDTYKSMVMSADIARSEVVDIVDNLIGGRARKIVRKVVPRKEKKGTI